MGIFCFPSLKKCERRQGGKDGENSAMYGGTDVLYCAKVTMEIIGHAKITQFFEKAIAANRLAHAYFFVGPQSVGTRTTALWLAEKLLKTKNPAAHPDFVLVERKMDEKKDTLKHDITIDQIRELQSRLAQSSFFGGTKIAIIDGVDDLNIKGANALLKLLEEPSGRAVIILIGRSIEAVPKTIRSRTQIVRFAPVPVKTMVAAGIEEELARAAMGAPGIALRMREEGKEIVEDEVREFEQLLEMPIWKRMKKIDAWFGKKSGHAETTQAFEARFRIWRSVLRDRLLEDSGAGDLVQLPKVRENMGNYDPLEILHAIDRAEEGIRQNGNLRYLIEALFLTHERK